ncbi:MAG: isoleucine--tRNA ligase [Pirellulales bacterium]|nr:isoleucine--tRNA ligase [Pirellulales bacterium]
MFQPVDRNPNFPLLESSVGRFWKEHRIYEKSLEQRAGAQSFVFYEGPPTANGMPHPGHCLTRAIKDLFPRYKTMRGYRCERKAGWDTHGLPVEVEVCKELGIHSKEEIEAYGIEPFIQKCQQSVWRYMREWERLTERIGFWVDLKNAYATYHRSYVESVWWSLKNLFDRGLLYQGHKVVWWWAQGGTALSAGEVGQGYRQVADPSVYVKFPLLDDAGNVTDTSLLVWTTTPWTLPSNQFAAVHPDLEYSVLGTQYEGKPAKLIVATALVETLRSKSKEELPEVDKPKRGRDIVGFRYLPPFEDYYERFKDAKGKLKDGGILMCPSDNQQEELYWKIVAADYVTIESGSGIVHIAPAFGEADFEVLRSERDRFMSFEPVNSPPNSFGIALLEQPALLCSVGPNGKFTDEAPEYCRGRWVKDCDKDIIRDLKQRGLLFHQEQYLHEYPFCWRAEEDPLIQYPRQSWFIRTTAFKDEMLANNAKINWLPEHIKDGRFGKFLESNVDWALSRERYWGTPLPIWRCTNPGCKSKEAIANYDELLAKPGCRGTEVWTDAKLANPELPEDIKVHKPYIDAVCYSCADCKTGIMRRVPEVIDCWYDSGAMPFAQWGYQGNDEARMTNDERTSEHSSSPELAENASRFRSQFPADFISEAIDQTRGWFYSQLAISTLLFGERGARSEEREILASRNSQLATHPYPHPFRNCIVLGLMLGEDGQKMSKSKRNYLPPEEIFDKYGADALRWYFFANQPPWTSIRYSEQAIKDSIPEFLLRLWNVYSFFAIYANIDGFAPAIELSQKTGDTISGDTIAGFMRTGTSHKAGDGIAGHHVAGLDSPFLAAATSYRPIAERDELDRWVLSELNRTVAAVIERMDAYDNFGACQHITAFVDALSNWYVRRSRDRFWAAEKHSIDKLDAYWTLYETLVTTSKMVAPFVPFVAETMWQNLARQGCQASTASLLSPRESVHLCDYPTPNMAVVDEELSDRMNVVRLIASLGLNARNAASLKVRQPLAKVEVILADTRHQAWLEEHASVIEKELNVKQLEFCDDPAQYVEHEVVPNFKLLGPKLGKLLPKVKQWLAKQTGAELLANIRDNGKIDLTLEGQEIALLPEEVEVRIRPRPGWTAANGQGVVVVLSTELTPELVAEGLARDVVRLIQERRKEIGCEYTDRIEVGLVTTSAELASAIEQHADFIQQETLSIGIGNQPLASIEPTQADIAGHEVAVYVRIAT